MPPLNIASCHTSLSWDSDMVSPPEARPWSLDSDPELDNENHRLVSGSKQVTGHTSLRWAPDLVTPPELRSRSWQLEQERSIIKDRLIGYNGH